jgi:hypothetical protein
MTGLIVLKIFGSGSPVAGDHIVWISMNGKGLVYAVRDTRCSTFMRINEREFNSLKHVLVKQKVGHSSRFVLSPAKVLKLRANTWFKKQYKQQRKNNSYEQPKYSTS